MLAAGSQVGRYVIKRKLAEGGMAEIFLASAVGPEGFAKDVVIKVVRSFLATDSQFVQMFIAEARLVSRLNHANVVQIFDFGKHGDSYYLAMEYVHGASLWDLRRKCRELMVPFPPVLAAEIGAAVARGLHYAHSLTENGQKIGVVHRDVTPHNVLLSFDGAVKLTDFGIAKATTTHTAPGMLKGKFAYMSPEQARGEKVDARTDLFALGIVLWELVTGGRLFEGESDLAVLRAVTESLIPPPIRVNPDVPQELSEVIAKALARPLDERFQSGFELERALANFVLRNAKSAEDASVAGFLQTIFKDEIARGDSGQAPIASPGSVPTDSGPHQTLPPDDEFGLGNTVAKAPHRTITATPVGPAPSGKVKTLTTPARARGVMDDDDAPSVRTEEFAEEGKPPKPQTEQMPALKRPTNRRFDPLPVQEPSVVRPSGQLPVVKEATVYVRPSINLPVQPSRQVVGDDTLKGMEPLSFSPEPVHAAGVEPAASVSAGEAPSAPDAPEAPDVVPPKSNTTLFAVLGILLVGVVGGAMVLAMGSKQPETPATETPAEPPVVAAELRAPETGSKPPGDPDGVPTVENTDSQTAPQPNTPQANTPQANTPSGNTPSGNTPSGNTPSANTPPANTPSANTPPGNTPPGNTPSGNTPSGNTPPANTPPANTPPENTPSGVNPPVKNRPKAVPASPPKMGTITVKAVPFATVIIQGKRYEVNALTALPAPAGTYEITLQHPRKTVKEKVTVPPNGTVNVSFSAN